MLANPKFAVIFKPYPTSFVAKLVKVFLDDAKEKTLPLYMIEEIIEYMFERIFHEAVHNGTPYRFKSPALGMIYMSEHKSKQGVKHDMKYNFKDFTMRWKLGSVMQAKFNDRYTQAARRKYLTNRIAYLT